MYKLDIPDSLLTYRHPHSCLQAWPNDYEASRYIYGFKAPRFKWINYASVLLIVATIAIWVK